MSSFVVGISEPLAEFLAAESVRDGEHAHVVGHPARPGRHKVRDAPTEIIQVFRGFTGLSSFLDFTGFLGGFYLIGRNSQ